MITNGNSSKNKNGKSGNNRTIILGIIAAAVFVGVILSFILF